ncbi:LOW QUALITY PROTEIN: hypothetical protein HID58_067448 [Brassica napus]|uniref:Uncharacterized protein n=1 Tax=Brassica napus TaxID=3708 RepID=A0ABQ7ZIJ0_BRANA|nr:LOW QUALITY PROTEIN: hypothetical protein HID58_067448 [Brassica napus]
MDSEHGGTLLMSGRSWPEPINKVVDVLQRAYIHLVDSNRRDQPVIGVSKNKVFKVWNLALAALELHEKSLGLEDGGRSQTRGQGPVTGGRTQTWGQEPRTRNLGPRGRNPDPWGRDLEDGSWSNPFMEYFSPTAGNNMTFFIGLYNLHRSITLPCRSFSDALALGVKGFAAWLEIHCPQGGDRPELAEKSGNIGIKGDASGHTPGACAASLYSASAQEGLSGSTNRVEECMGQYPGILRGRILARLRIRRTKRLNMTRRPKLRIFMLDCTGLACASRACKVCNGLSGGSPCRCSFLPHLRIVPGLLVGGTFSMFVLVPGDNLVDSWYRSRSLGLINFNLPPEVSHNQCWDNLALCSHGIRRILLKSEEVHSSETHRFGDVILLKLEVVYIFVQEPEGWMDCRQGICWLCGPSRGPSRISFRLEVVFAGLTHVGFLEQCLPLRRPATLWEDLKTEPYVLGS